MGRIFFEATQSLPGYDFSPDGILKIERRSIPENAAIFYDFLISFVDALSSPQVVFDIHLEYFNTFSSKKLANSKINAIRLNWHYEEGLKQPKYMKIAYSVLISTIINMPKFFKCIGEARLLNRRK